MASHEISKLVDGSGDEFNFRDPTKESLANKVTSVRASSSATDTNYPSEKAVRTELDKMAPGAITTDVVVANGDKLLFSDVSDNGKIKRMSGVTFDAATKNRFLSRNGTFEQVLEADVGWGGAARSGSKAPIETFTRQNAWFGPKPSAVYAEYTTNLTADNPTWTDYGLTNVQKQKIFSGTDMSAAVTAGKATHVHPGYTGTTTAEKDLTPEMEPDQGVRVTICCRSLSTRDVDTDNWCYSYLRRILIYVSTSSSRDMKVKVERQTGTRYKSNDDVWEDLGTFDLSGDSGWNSIPVENNFGGGWSQNSNIYSMRFTFWAESMLPTPAASQTGCCRVMGIVALNHIMWTASGLSPEMQKSGLPCAIAYDGSVTFPANVKAPTFDGKLKTARKLAVSLSNTSTDTSFDGSSDVTNIKTTGTLGVGNGGTGKASVTSGNYLVGNGTSAFTEKTPKTVGNNVLAALDAGAAAFSTDDAVIITGDSAAANTTTFYRRKFSYIWTWIQSKISTVLGLSTTGYTGNAATATALEAGGADRVKLDGIEAGANNYVHPTSAGNKHVPSGGSDGKFLGYGGSSGTAAWVDNPASGKADNVSFVFTANGADANLNARLLAAVKLSGSTLSSVRLSFVMAVDIGIGSDGVKGGILRADIAVNSSGQFFAKKCWLTAVTGILSSSDFKIAYGSVSGGNMAVGVVHDGTLADGRSLYVRVLDSYVSGGDLVTNAAITAGKTYESWGSVGQSADDGAVVHKTGDESVGGKKTFTDPVVESVSTSGDYSGFFVQRGSTAATRYRASLEVVDSGSRGLFDYGGSSYAGEDKWIIRKTSDNSIDVGEASNRNKVRLGGVTLDFSGTVGNVADTFYIAN